MSAAPHFLRPLLEEGRAQHALCHSRTGHVIATELELTVDSRSRRRGLLGRTGLAENAAMIIAPCNAVHTFFMRFTIDVVFVDRQGRVVKLCRSLRPWRIGIGVKGFAAVELADGSIDRCEICKGDRLTTIVLVPPIVRAISQVVG